MLRRSILLFSLSLLAAAALLVSCHRSSPTPNPTPTTNFLRIVSLSPAAADILRDLGLADSLVGRNSADAWTDRSIPSCGELGRIDYEALLATRPTHVFVQEPSMPPRLEQLAAQHGFLALNLSLLSLDEIRTSTRRIVDSLPPAQRVAATPELDRIEVAMNRAWAPSTASYQGPILLLASIDPPAALGPGSFHVQILQDLGGTNTPAAGPPYITLSAEDIVALAPAAIILIQPRAAAHPAHEHTTDQALAALGVLARLDTPAVRTRRVALIDDPKAHLPSTAMIDLADQMRGIIERWARVAPGPPD